MQHLKANLYVLSDFIFSIIKILSIKNSYMVHICEAFGCLCHKKAMELV